MRKNYIRNLGSILLLRFFHLSYAIWDNSAKSISLKSRFLNYFLTKGGFYYNLLRAWGLPPNFKMEILTVFSISNSLFLLKMEILTLFSILNNEKSGKLRADSTKSILSHFLFPDFLFFCIYNYLENRILISIYFLV